MSVFIKGIHKTKKCKTCLLFNYRKSQCPLQSLKNPYRVDLDEIYANCPLKDVPQKRLIDADRLIAMILSAAGDMMTVPLSAVINSIKSAPTVIDGREDNDG